MLDSREVLHSAGSLRDAVEYGSAEGLRGFALCIFRDGGCTEGFGKNVGVKGCWSYSVKILFFDKTAEISPNFIDIAFVIEFCQRTESYFFGL